MIASDNKKYFEICKLNRRLTFENLFSYHIQHQIKFTVKSGSLLSDQAYQKQSKQE